MCVALTLLLTSSNNKKYVTIFLIYNLYKAIKLPAII